MSHHPGESAAQASRPAVSLHRLREMAGRGERIVMNTCYDATFARLLDAAGTDTVLVGDSLGNVIQGHASTNPVTLAQVAYHTECVARTKPKFWLIADLPFGSYEAGGAQALDAAATLIRAGAQMVKLEGAGPVIDTVHYLTQRGISVCAHLGLTPQRVHALGGFRIQGKDDQAAQQLLADARALHEAGAAMLVLELMPSRVGRLITEALPELITIGIGAGADVRGQVLVLQDMLGLSMGKAPRFVRDFTKGLAGESAALLSVPQALKRYVDDVRSGAFPLEAEHGY